jgi:Ribbon-helix-helix protein, copG family
MRRTTIFLDPDLLRRAQEEAQREGKSFAGLVREAVAAYLDRKVPEPGRLPSIAGRFSSGRSDTAERSDELLWEDPHS